MMKTISFMLLTFVIIGFVITLTLGEHKVPVAEIISVLLNAENVNPEAKLVIMSVRLPRALLAILIGIALAVAGVIAQAVLRNPLAEPGLIGINSGAALAAMFIIIQLDSVPLNVLHFFSFAGALVMAMAVYFLSWRDGLSPMRLILVGIGLNALAAAGASFLTTFGDISLVQRAMIWMAGSLYDSNWTKLQALAIWITLPLAVTWALSRELDLLAFGENTARSLGQSVNLFRSVLLLLCAMMSGAAVSAAGLIAFVGLIAPHMARALVGNDHARLLPVSALCGALLVMCSDMVGRTIIAPLQLPVGLMTAILGAPFFIYLMLKRSYV